MLYVNGGAFGESYYCEMVYMFQYLVYGHLMHFLCDSKVQYDSLFWSSLLSQRNASADCHVMGVGFRKVRGLGVSGRGC